MVDAEERQEDISSQVAKLAASVGGYIPDEITGFVQHDGGLLQIDDVDAITLSEDILLHAGIPAAGLMPEVGTGF